jgi:hypothetical protein
MMYVENFPLTVVGFFLISHRYPNNSVVALEQDWSALYCLTNLTTCCTEAEGGVAGEWFLPGQAQAVVGDDAQGAGSTVFTTRVPSGLLLNHKRTAVGPPTGIYTCRIPDESGQIRTVYIGMNTGKCDFHKISYARTTNDAQGL